MYLLYGAYRSCTTLPPDGAYRPCTTHIICLTTENSMLSKNLVDAELLADTLRDEHVVSEEEAMSGS